MGLCMFSNSNDSEEKPVEGSMLMELVDKFSYKNINAVGGEQDALTHLDWEAFPNTLSKDFVSLYKDRKSQGMEKDDGLKLHISLANVENNVKKGWDIVGRYIIKNNIINCKVIRDHLRNEMMVDKAQSGKEITIYVYKNPEITDNEWEKIIQEITEDLAKNKIVPGPKPSSDYEINGCNYISHRGYKQSFQPQTTQLEFISDKEEDSPEIPEYIISKEDEILLAETNLIRIEKARRALYDPKIGLASESSDSAPSSPAAGASGSDTKSESSISNESDINLPFSTTVISVAGQPKRMSLGELRVLQNSESSEDLTDLSEQRNELKKYKGLSRTTSIGNFSSFHSAPKSVSETGSDKGLNKKISFQNNK
jgi:hypothetical protein